MTTAILDHVVINTRRSMDAAAAAFEAKWAGREVNQNR